MKTIKEVNREEINLHEDNGEMDDSRNVNGTYGYSYQRLWEKDHRSGSQELLFY